MIVSGSVTIGMMKRNGYRPYGRRHRGGRVDGRPDHAALMGITAFLIAENLEVSYGVVALAALLPALLYYLSLFIQVDLEAAKLNLRGCPQRICRNCRPR